MCPKKKSASKRRLSLGTKSLGYFPGLFIGNNIFDSAADNYWKQIQVRRGERFKLRIFLPEASWVSTVCESQVKYKLSSFYTAGNRPPAQISWRLERALSIVTSSTNSRSDPTGIPMAMRVTFTPKGFNSRAT